MYNNLFVLRLTNARASRCAGSGAARWRRAGSRHGYTLLEILLVLALLVIFAALAIPALIRPLEGQRVRKAADGVQAAWIRASNESVKSGQMYLFRYEPQGRGFTIEPWASADDYLETGDTSYATPGVTRGPTASAPPGQLGSTTAAPGEMLPTGWKQLPEGIMFVGGQTVPETRASVAGVAGTSGVEASAGPVSGEAPPILFYPDGTCSTAEVTIANEAGICVTIRLRGLTATTEVSDEFRMEGLQGLGATP
jgi:prepilin-type N-terminal cleavage/methylation domain-containing protein